MKAIARVLEITGFVATFVAFAFALANTIDSGNCMRIAIGPLEWWSLFLMTALVLGFGAAGRNELPKRRLLAFWAVSALFFTAQSAFLQLPGYGSFEQKWRDVVAVVSPDLRLGDGLAALGAFYADVVRYWMPFASVMSVVAFAIAFFRAPGTGSGDGSERTCTRSAASLPRRR